LYIAAEQPKFGDYILRMMRMKLFFLMALIFLAGCTRRLKQNDHPDKNQTEINEGKYFWKDAGTDAEAGVSCPGRVFPERYRLLKTNYSGLRKLLIGNNDEKRTLDLDTVILAVPLPGGSFEEFAITKIQVLPPELADKYPGIKTYHGKSLVFPQDNIRLDISPKGFTMMILSTRGTIIMDPYCSTDSIHVISYFKKDLPEGAKEDFEK